MTNEQRRAKHKRDKKLERWMAKIQRERAAAGLCRHCGGSIPCWSDFGDKVQMGARQAKQ